MASIGTINDNILTSLTLGANVALGQAATLVFNNGLQDAVTAGVTVSGGSDNAHVTINLTGAASGKTDGITLGNGNDIVYDVSTAGTVNVVVGTGSNYILFGSNSADTTGAYTLSLGAHTVATGIDQIYIGNAGTAFATTSNLVVTGAVTGDWIVLLNDLGHANTVLAAVTAGATAALTITAIEAAAAAGAHDVAYSVFGGNTYVAENNAGVAASATNTTLVELIGTHTFTAGTGMITIAS
jgi:hypothetical protein